MLMRYRTRKWKKKEEIVSNIYRNYIGVVKSTLSCKILMSGNLLLHSKKKKNYNKQNNPCRGDAPAKKKIYKSIDRQLKTLVNT